MKEVEFARNLVTKFCHDMAGVVSATSNSLEFIDSEDPNTRKKANDLLLVSANHALLKLKFFRYAYGDLGALQDADLDNVKSLSEEYLKYKDVSLDFIVENGNKSEVPINALFGRLILCIIYIISEDFFERGNVKLSIINTDKGPILKIIGAGSRIKKDNKKFDIMGSDQLSDKLDPFNIHYVYTKTILDDLGCKMRRDSSVEGRVEYILEN